jgi:hypothetical protein
MDYREKPDRIQKLNAGMNNGPVAFILSDISACTTTTVPKATINPASTPRAISRGDEQICRTKPKSLLEKLERVSDTWDDFKESRNRRAIYRYLRVVYDLVGEYQRKRRTVRLARRAYKYIGLPFDRNADVFATVIRGTSGGEVDNKTISKWSRALRFVAKSKKARTPLKQFMLRMGGVNVCASLYAKSFGR